MPTVYPCVPGHEIVGRVAKVDSAVVTFKSGEDALSVRNPLIVVSLD
jgi:alcohol dehydrogenase (NADP+)